MKDNKLLSEEELDFLKEMMSIGTGNATTALTDLFKCRVDVKMPNIYILINIFFSINGLA